MKRRLRGVWKEEFLTNEKYFIMHGYIYMELSICEKKCLGMKISSNTSKFSNL